MRAPGARPKSARVGYSTCALGSLLANETTVPSGATRWIAAPSDGAADALDDHVEARPLGRELVDDLVGAEVGEAAGALGAGRDGGDVGAADVGELDGEAPDAAAGAGHQHAPGDRGAADVEGQQGGDAGDGQRRGLGEAHLVGQDGDARASGTAASCAHALSWSATTRAPSGGPLPSAAGAPHASRRGPSR